VEPPLFRVELELEGAPVTVAADEIGRGFAFEGVPHGVVRLRLVPEEGLETVLTEWLRA
jgi:hypothetical protein